MAEAAEAEPERPSTATRVARIAASLVSIHLQVARDEVGRDQRRLLRGALYCLAALVLLALCGVLLQLAGVWLLHDLGLRWLWAVLLMAAADLLLALLLLLRGRGNLRAPLMPETRALLRRTLNALLEP